MIRLGKVVTVLCALALAALWASPARAQGGEEKEKPHVYTYVAQWDVPRADWATFEKPNPPFDALMAKLLADGTVLDHGGFKSVAHQEGSPNHGGWWSATSVGNLMKALSAIASLKGNPELEKIQAASKHWDYILDSRLYGAKHGSFENGYLRVGAYKSKPHEGEQTDKMVKAYIVPLLEKLLADGSIYAYSIDHEAIHTADPSYFWIVIIANGPEGLDKFYEGLESTGKSNPTGGPAFGSTVESADHRDSLSLASGTYK
ncbi:MAG TPA: hypothetical protein VEG64_18000 [Candidatus Sulfotelmatobacter sp.]|nr:hypothetical protein [Candidatus Sulfotelmatobacter sp.]